MSGLFRSAKKRINKFADPLGILSNSGKKLAADPLGILGVGEDKGMNIVSAVKSAFGDQAPAAAVEPPIPMPDPEGASFQAARRRATLEQRRRRGRASTIFTAFDGDTLG